MDLFDDYKNGISYIWGAIVLGILLGISLKIDKITTLLEEMK
jgi:hypothetical protein